VWFLALVMASTSHARVQRDVLSRKKGSTKVAAQWTLQDWLNDENQSSLVNSVLTLDRNTDWYEVNVRARAGQTRRAGRANEEQRQLDLDAYLLIFNLHGEWEQTSSRRDATAAAVGARLVGTSTRTTNVVARYGWQRQRDLDVSARTFARRFVEGQAQLYVSRWFGLEGGYRHYEPKDARIEAGTFVEWQPLRVSIDYQREDVGGILREVYIGGVKAFF